MIILDTVNKLLEVSLATPVVSNQLPVVSGFVDIQQQTSSLTGTIEFDNATNDLAYVTLVPAPASLHSRMVRWLSVQNADTAPATVAIDLNNNGTRRVIWRGVLSVGDTLQYDESHGFSVFDALGQIKTAGSIQYTDGSTSTPVVGTVGMAVVEDATASYAPGQVRPGSLRPDGALRVTNSPDRHGVFVPEDHPFGLMLGFVGNAWAF